MIGLVALPLFCWIFFRRLQDLGFPSDFPGAAATGTLALIEAFIATTIVTALYNSIWMTYVYRRFFGGPSMATIRQMWVIKDGAVKGANLDFTGKGSRVPTAQAINLYLIFAVVVGIVGFALRHPWKGELAFLVAALLVALVPTNFLMHGRPPTLLLLGHSGKEATAFKTLLVGRFLRVGVSSLLDVENSISNWLLVGSGSRMRAREELAGTWREIFQRLATFAKVIVVDCRHSTDLVAEELAWLRENVDHERLILFADPECELPAGLAGTVEVTGDVLECERLITRKLNLTRLEAFFLLGSRLPFLVAAKGAGARP